MMNFRTLKEDLAETLFSTYLDEIFMKGIEEGRRNTANIIAFKLKNTDLKLTPARREGYEKAIDIVTEIQEAAR